MLKIHSQKARRATISDLLVAALALDEISNQFKIHFSPDNALQFAKRCTEHGVTNHQFAKLVEKINSVSPRHELGDSNPNTGHHFHNFDIGKEYSRVIYVHYAKLFTVLKSDAACARLIAEIHTAAKAAGANEIDVEENTDTMLTIRIWWD